jgi:hypothetical protein
MSPTRSDTNLSIVFASRFEANYYDVDFTLLDKDGVSGASQ